MIMIRVIFILDNTANTFHSTMKLLNKIKIPKIFIATFSRSTADTANFIAVL